MIIDLTGRKAIVTGSTAGIGRATAEGLARAGAAVVVNGRTDARVEEAVRQIRQTAPHADITGVRRGHGDGRRRGGADRRGA